MAKRMQEQKEEDRIVAKSKPTAMKLTSTVSTSSSSVNHPIASKSPGILKASTGKPDAMARRNSKPDAASSSQLVEVAEKLAATDKSQESSSHQKEVTWKPVASRNSGNSESSEVGSRKGTRHFDMSPVVVPHVEKVCSIVQKVYGRSPTDDLNDLDVNNAMWCIFMNVTLQAVVHPGRDSMENRRFTKNQLLKSVNVIPCD